jgi:GNAT superfamily N-acetyltransferase
MHNISLRTPANDDADFALQVTESCMRAYAERTWGSWNGFADFDLATDRIVERDEHAIGLIGVDRHQEYWDLEKLYLLPDHQNEGIGTILLRFLIAYAYSEGVSLRLSVLEVNPARRFYERQGFI